MPKKKVVLVEEKVEVKKEKEVDPRVARYNELVDKSPLTPAEWIEKNDLENDLKTEGVI